MGIDWDFLLDCPTGCLDVVVTPIPGSSPPSITYTVCGTLPGACNPQTFCDTVTVTIYPDLFTDAGPDVAFCDGSFVARFSGERYRTIMVLLFYFVFGL